jgi:hypothetical protein
VGGCQPALALDEDDDPGRCCREEEEEVVEEECVWARKAGGGSRGGRGLGRRAEGCAMPTRSLISSCDSVEDLLQENPHCGGTGFRV